MLDPVIVGVFAAALSLVGAGRPSFWYDEAATISASYSRSLGQLWQMMGNVDAVHGLYYVLMHGWFTIFPPTEFWSRVPSGLAVGGAAAGVVVLGKQFSSRTVALSAGVICAILPRATWAGIEARPYALTMMVAAWSTVLLVHAVRRDNDWIWLCYAVAMAAAILLDVYLALMFLAHAVFLCFYRPGRAVVVRFAITAVCTCLAVAPFVRHGRRSSASDHLDLTGRPPDDRRRRRSAVLRKKPAVSDRVGLRRGDGSHLVALHFCATGRAGPPALSLAIAWLVVPTALILGWLGRGPSDIHASLPVLHRTGDGTRAGRVRRRVGGAAVGGRSRARRLHACRGAELSTGTTQSVCEVWNGLQPGRRPDRRKGKGRAG